jgi:DivIVA domain-containing protein
MADDVTPSDVEARRFDIARRGYDRAQVDEYLLGLIDELKRLKIELEERKTKELKVGLDDPEALALELGTIGGEIATILESARAAADGMRGRAAADADEWRTSTEQETRTLADDASEQSQSMRAAAWNEGSSMLASSVAEAKSQVEAAQEDALFIRAEAEREAIRRTGDAKRDSEELIRAARLESEEMIERVRGESEGILAAASQQAEQAQERARALEDRRAKLLSELESTRASIGQLEEEIDSKRQALEAPEPVVVPEPDPRTHHSGDSGSVRIVAPSKSRKLKPVDAEELVADVVALRSSMQVDIEPEAIPASEPEVVPPPEPVLIETVAVIAPPPVDVTDDAAQATDEKMKEDDPVTSDEGSTSSGDSRTPESSADEIGTLFASLREDTASQPEVSVESEAADVVIASETDGAVSNNSESETVVEHEDTPSDEVGGDGSGSSLDGSTDPEVLDAELIPLQNAALKDIKRTLVDLQNDALEHLRTDPDWVPKKTFTNKFKVPFGELAVGITESKDDDGAAKEFSADLNAAVVGAIVKGRESGAGNREVASSVSRVFRMWRADESERRVVDAALALSQRSTH